MKPKERYLATVNHRAVDRPPVDLMGTACGLTDGALVKLKVRLGINSRDTVFRGGENVRLYNEDILDALHIDARRVWLRPLSTASPGEGEEIIDEWGLRLKKTGGYLQQAGHPLENATLRDIEHYPWPAGNDPRRFAGLREEAIRLHNEGKFAVIGRSPTAGFFERGCWLRGMEKYLTDMMIEPEIIEALNERITAVHAQMYGDFLDVCGDCLDVIETADDYGSATGMLVSLDLFQSLIKPWRAKLNQAIKKRCPHIKIFLHTCGNVHELIPDLIETGIDILNPTQPVAGMEPHRLAQRFGRAICFHGAIDTVSLVRQSVPDVKNEIARLRSDFAGASWIAAPANHLQEDVPPENIVAMYESITGVGPG